MSDLEKSIETLLLRAANANDADAAMRFSQAALNAAHVLKMIGKEPEKTLE